LNDQYTFKTGQSSSLWDTQNKCKPGFFAVAGVGIHYNELDSVVSSADTLKQSDYTAASWPRFAAALASAKIARGQNYSPSVSADTALGAATDSLKAGIDGLVKTLNGVAVVGNNPEAFTLSQNYPNPFNPTTVISWQLPVASTVRIVVYDILGREVAVLVHEQQAPGPHSVTWNASGVASGMYMYRLAAGTFAASRTMLLVK
jgi:hypothetical protein